MDTKNTPALAPVAQLVFNLVKDVKRSLVGNIADELGLTRAQVFGALRTVKAAGLVTVTKTTSGTFMVSLVEAAPKAKRFVLVSHIGAYLGEGTATSRKDAETQGSAMLAKLGRKRGSVNF